MNHSWKKIDKYNSICRICGCKREIIYEYGKGYPYYIRSGQVHGLSNPDCIDWDNENKKSID